MNTAAQWFPIYKPDPFQHSSWEELNTEEWEQQKLAEWSKNNC